MEIGKSLYISVGKSVVDSIYEITWNSTVNSINDSMWILSYTSLWRRQTINPRTYEYGYR